MAMEMVSSIVVRQMYRFDSTLSIAGRPKAHSSVSTVEVHIDEYTRSLLITLSCDFPSCQWYAGSNEATHDLHLIHLPLRLDFHLPFDSIRTPSS